MKTTIEFGLLTVEVTILVADLQDSDNNRFRIESVTNEHGAKTGLSDDMMDSFEIYLESLLPALINPSRTVRVRHAGSSMGIDSNEVTDVVAARIMKQMNWTPENCEIVEEESGFEAAIDRYNAAVETLTTIEEDDFSKEFDSAAEYWANQYGDEIACLPPKKVDQRTPRTQHDSWVDGEIGVTLATMGINL